MTLLTTLIGTLLFAVAGPVIGCLLAGLDRIISARMQGRVGPPLLQPYYDVRKLFEKERVSVNSVEGVYVACALLFALIAGGIFYSGGNLLLCVFVITLSSLFFIMAAYSTRSPYAEVGAAREQRHPDIGDRRAEQHALDHRIRQLLKRSFQTAAGGFFKTAAKQCHTIKEHCQAA